mgnify:CR=1 FL=1
MHDKMVKKLKFQYSFCSYSTVSFGREQHCFGRFNTASVLIQPSNTICHGIRFVVSIQLLFLFNGMWRREILADGCFNTASVLIQLEGLEGNAFRKLFQYSFCSYSTKCPPKSIETRMFQYSFCSYSTGILQLDGAGVGFNTASVLIQHTGLPRWPDLFCSFNTASVLIQLYTA